jgi:hypothetical protein
MAIGGITTIATNKLHAAHNLEEEENAGSVASSINSMQSHMVVNVSGDNFHDAQKELLKPDEQPD